ncbi:MAG: Pilin/Flagellin, PilA family [Candidatus Methanohalarchaeum thermophilum]|uniref:Pilin/Flagellin, PilA family n=1 Tax=Methanohalarchaeum thermophilum TaxID=1903181 RepID=A0A1Q6DVA6_METT1|nr:MAG: Pilin/Flagellin, PilA family [Candidatus Methanohalarchaeum thermophilum]
MKKKLKLLKEKEGVSPVIGVILMVAITVIMAAIVAGFVFGVIQTPQATPTASITIDDISMDVQGDNDTITLLHQSGEPLLINDTDVTIYNQGNNSQVATFSLYNLSSSDGGNASALDDGEFSTGERITISSADIDDFGEGAIESGDTIEVRIIDSASGGTISAPTATAP